MKRTYGKETHMNHVLIRPDSYVGSVRPRKIEEFVVIDDNFNIRKKFIEISPAIIRIFVEPLSNAIDNWTRSKKLGKKYEMKELRVTINEKSGETSFWNDGLVIPIELHEKEGCYNHSLIFGELLTGENYNDEEERENISGRNGYGVKLSNIFSTEFTVEGVDPETKNHLKQSWTENMKKPGNPIVLKTKEKKGYTKVTYTPDFPRFGITGYTQDIISLYKRFLVDTAMITKIPVYFNDELIPVSSLKEYSELYDMNSEHTLLIKTKNCEVFVCESKQFEIISFANGVYTPMGGVHVDPWSEALFRPIVEKMNKGSRPKVNIKDVKQFFRLFVIASVINPEFDTQSKYKLESPEVKAEVKTTHINKICKWPVMERIEELIRSKEFSALKKLERKGKKYTKIDSLDSANNEGGKYSTECTLILVEGLSAKTYAVHGIDTGVFGKSGRDWFGIYALRGKVLNCRNATTKSIKANKVVDDVIKALGLKLGADYTDEQNYKKLRYGRVLIITDADCDGIHISGLIQNMFHALFPTLLERKESFITAMQTPIVRVFLNKTKSKLFYDENEYRRWLRAYNKKFPGKKIDKKYYKGLGTNNEEDIDESFGRKIVEFRPDEKTFESMNKAFHTKYSDARKDWLELYDPNRTVLKWKGNDHETSQLGITDFIDTELIKFSHDDCKRSIPSLIDGLKEGHRKVLYSCFLRNLKYTGKTLKVAQLAGYVAEKSAYHHGEGNLLDTITSMASSFVGSNNIPLLFRDGQFGTRVYGGKDAANGRYIFTKLDMLTRLIFRPEDDNLLTYREDDGDKVEPYFYVPIIPMVLVNGSSGIGTGWSTNVPCYNPIDLINAIKIWLQKDGNVLYKEDDTTISLLPEMIPWYRGHKGEMTEEKSGKFTSWGIIEQDKNKTVITELPVGEWTDKYKEKLEKWKESKEIKDFKNHSTPKEVKFTVKEDPDGMSFNLKNLKLTSTINTSNMCLFDKTEHLQKYDTAEEIIDEFCKVRYEYYVKRKRYQLDNLDRKIKFMGNKKRFLIEVRDGIIVLFEEKNGKRQSRKIKDLVDELKERGYDKETEISDDEENENDIEEKENGYNYLLRLQFRSITDENINKLSKDIASSIKERDELFNTSEKELWLKDLEELETVYHKWLNIISKEKVKTRKVKGKGK